MRLSDTSLQIKRNFLYKYLAYANNHYVINRIIFFLYCLFRFEIPKSYAIKRFMRLTDIQLAEVFYLKTLFK